MAGGQISKKKIELAIRRNAVLNLRMQGGDWREIADTLRDARETDGAVPGVTEKYSHVLAYHDAKVEMQRLAAENKEMAAYELDVQLEQLMKLWAKFYPLAIERGDYLAFDRCLMIQQRRAKLLDVEPTERKQIDIKVSDLDATIERELAQLVARSKVSLTDETAGAQQPTIDPDDAALSTKTGHH